MDVQGVKTECRATGVQPAHLDYNHVPSIRFRNGSSVCNSGCDLTTGQRLSWLQPQAPVYPRLMLFVFCSYGQAVMKCQFPPCATNKSILLLIFIQIHRGSGWKDPLWIWMSLLLRKRRCLLSCVHSFCSLCHFNHYQTLKWCLNPS